MYTAVQNRLKEPHPQLNMTPLFDVLLIMFMLTLPVMTHTLPLNLGQRANHRKPKPPVAGLTKAMLQRSERAKFHLRAARLVRFEFVAKLLAEAEPNGARRIAFLGNERFLE